MVAGLGKTADVITVTSKGVFFFKKNGKDKKGEEVIQPICYLTRRREGPSSPAPRSGRAGSAINCINKFRPCDRTCLSSSSRAVPQDPGSIAGAKVCLVLLSNHGCISCLMVVSGFSVPLVSPKG